jgi:hypothetical protein
MSKKGNTFLTAKLMKKIKKMKGECDGKARTKET